MTKFKGAHSEPLFTLLRTGMYTLKGEKPSWRIVQLNDKLELCHDIK